jgi:hypothetical protein
VANSSRDKTPESLGNMLLLRREFMDHSAAACENPGKAIITYLSGAWKWELVPWFRFA